MENLVLDSEILLATADIINNYAERQKATIDRFLRNISNLGGEWQDDETFSKLYMEVSDIYSKVVDVMEDVNNSANYFRERAEQIESRPVFDGNRISETSSLGTPLGSSAGAKTTSRFYSSVEKIMSKTALSAFSLNDEMCEVDGVGKIADYVKISSNGRRIDDLESVGDFLSPANGEKIYCRTIAWRCYGIGEANSQNVCGADFYYADGTYCGSYTGKNWQDIYENNVSDTKMFRK